MSDVDVSPHVDEPSVTTLSASINPLALVLDLDFSRRNACAFSVATLHVDDLFLELGLRRKTGGCSSGINRHESSLQV